MSSSHKLNQMAGRLPLLEPSLGAPLDFVNGKRDLHEALPEILTFHLSNGTPSIIR